MTVYNKLDEKVFASQAKPRETENFPNIARGWGISFEQTAGIPPMEWFNDLFKRIDEHMLYLAQRGLAEWSSTLEYPQGAYVQYNGKTYRSLQQNTNQQPDTPDSVYWNRWGFALSEIPYATLSQKGLAQLYTGYDSQREDLALTPKTAYLLKALIDSNSRSLNDRIPNSKKSDATDSNSSDTVATSKAVKEVKDIAESKQSPATTLEGYGITNFKVEQSTGNADDYKTDGSYYFASGQHLPDNNGAWHVEVVSGGQTTAVRQIARKANDTKVKTRFFNGSKWTEWKDIGGDGVPLGAIVAFPKEVKNPTGFLKCDGSTIDQRTYPDLYRTLGDKNTLPNLTRSDVGMTAYFATDKIPEGWIAFDEIKEKVKEETYPELYKYLIEKYKRIDAVPLAEDRFIRNAHGELKVGMTQPGSLIGADSIDGYGAFSPYVKAILGTYKETVNQVGFDPLLETEIGQNRRDSRHVVNNESSPDGGQPETKKQYNAGLSWSVGAGKNQDLNEPIKNNNTGNGHFVGVTRPKSLVLKLCIKAQNSLDDVVFWIKAFGAVENQGVLDASAIVQEMQDFKQQAEEKIQSITVQKEEIMHAIQEEMEKSDYSLVKVWEGNKQVGSYDNSYSINLNESCLGTTVYMFFYEPQNYRQTYLEVYAIDVLDPKLFDIDGKSWIKNYRYYLKATRYHRYSDRPYTPEFTQVEVNGDGITLTLLKVYELLPCREIYIKKPNNRKAR